MGQIKEVLITSAWRKTRRQIDIRDIRQFIHPVTITLFLCFSILLGFSIRTLNLPQLKEKYLLEGDCYRFLRQADIIASKGRLPQIDPMRWQPMGRDLSTHLNLFSYALAYSHRLLQLIQPNLTIYQVALYSSVSCYSLCLLFLYLIWRQIFDPSIGVLAVNLSAIFPSLNLHRSTAGFADRDAFCLLLWLGAFLFYLMSIDNRQIKAIIYAVISGIMAGMLALSWEGCGLATAIIAVWICLQILRGRFEPHDALVYSVWYTCYISIALSLTHAYRNVLLPYAFLAIVVPTVVLFCVIAFLSHLGKASWIRTLTNNFPFSKGIISCFLGGSVSILLFLSLAFLQSGHSLETLRLIQDNFMSPLGRSRLMRTVMELRDLSGPLWVRRYSVIIFTAIAGSVILVYRFFSSERIHFRFAMIGFELILCGTLLTLFVPLQNVSNSIYVATILAGSIVIFIAYMLSREIREAVPSNHEKVLLVLIWFFIVLFASRGAERYGFFLDPLVIVLSSFLIVKLLRFFTNGQTHPVLELCAIGILVISELYAGFRLSLWLGLTWWNILGLLALGLLFGGILISRLALNKGFHRQRFAYLGIILILVFFLGSGAIHKGFMTSSAEAVSRLINPPFPKLQDSFAEIAIHTDKKSTIAAWWDYGSMLNWHAKRATIIDEDHFIPYWIFMMARHVFAALSKEEALAFLRSHQATHLMITTNDIPRLLAISYIGSDATFDRAASISFLRPLTQKYVNPSVEVTDFIPSNLLTTTDVLELDGEKYIPGYWNIQRVSITYDHANDTWKAMVHGKADKKPFSKPPKEFRYGDKQSSHEKDGIPGSVVVFPNRDGKNFQAFYVSEVAKRLLAVRLYLFMEDIPGFSLVYDTNSITHCDPNGLRLWKLNYPKEIQAEDKYLSRDFPSTEKSLRESWQRGDFMGVQRF